MAAEFWPLAAVVGQAIAIAGVYLFMRLCQRRGWRPLAAKRAEHHASARQRWLPIEHHAQ
jgi:hypothetical protein